MSREKTKNFSRFFLSSLFVFSFFWHLETALGVSPVVSIVSDEVNFEAGKSFSAKVLLNTSGESIKKVDLVISYDKDILRVVDQDIKAGVQIGEKNELGSFQKNSVNEAEGKIEIAVLGLAKKGTEVLLAEILFEPKTVGRTEVKVEVANSKLIAENETEVGFRVRELMVTKIDEDRSGLKVIHAQNTYLAIENEAVKIEAGLSSPVPILEFKLFYRTLVEDGNFHEKWASVDMVKDETDQNKYNGEIPSRHVERPGITYYFTIRTANRQTTMPRPITLENVYKMKVVTAEEYYEKIGPELNFNPPSADFLDSINVVITSDDLNSTIYCTFDGTEPNESSYIYLNPFIFEETVTLKCLGVNDFGNKGPIRTGLYTKKTAGILADISADKIQIEAGEEVILTWETSNAKKASISPNLEEVSLNGQKNVYPRETTTFTLIATDEFESSINKSVTIYVNRPGGGEIKEKQEESYYPPENVKTGISEFLIYLYLLVTSGGVVYEIKRMKE